MASIVIVKLTLFIPAVIIVHDCKLFKSLSLLRQHRLRSAKELFLLYIVLIVGGILFWTLGLTLSNATTVFQYILAITCLSASRFLWLMVVTMAVIFVGRRSQEIVKIVR